MNAAALVRQPLVLVVDDSPEVLSMLNDALEQSGMTTLVALEGAQALRIARSMAPDVILLDAILPNMDGFAVCRQLKADPALAAIPVIFMTGLSDPHHVVQGFEAGGVDYVTKPMEPVALAARIKVHTARARASLAAQSALDKAGQCLLAVDDHGRVLWATPQAAQLLEPLRDGLQAALVRWLRRGPGEGASLRPAPDRALRLMLLGRAGTGEQMLRVINDDHPDEIQILREQLALTGREAEVLLWVAKGKGNREVGLILSMSPRTVNKHLEQIFRKLQVDNRTSAATLAVTALQRAFG